MQKLHPEQLCLVWTGQTDTPFLLLPLYFVASSVGPILALLDSGALHNFVLSVLVHELQDRGYTARDLGLQSWWFNLQTARICKAASAYWCASIWWLQMEQLYQVGRHIPV